MTGACLRVRARETRAGGAHIHAVWAATPSAAPEQDMADPAIACMVQLALPIECLQLTEVAAACVPALALRSTSSPILTSIRSSRAGHPVTAVRSASP